MRRLGAVLLIAPMVVAIAGAPAGPAAAGPGHRVLQVVAAENFWGSLASQLGGRQVQVTSIVSDPNADPHEYEANPTDARAFARADYVVVNGAGYDTWADKLLSAQPRPGRRVLTVASFLGRPNGSNPHLWYDPAAVSAVVDRITADYESLEPSERRYFATRHAAVEASLSPYRARLAALRATYAGTKVASTESIFEYMAAYLGLDLVTPPAFMDAVAEGVDPPAPSLVTFDRQIRTRGFSVLVYNTQTVTPLTTGIEDQARAQHIAVVGISETMQPPSSSFQRWMDGELDRLAAALSRRPKR